MSENPNTVKFDAITGGKLVSGVIFDDEYNIVDKSEKILESVGNLRYVGETGVGKTTLVHFLSQKLESPLFETVLTRDTTRWDLLATDTINKGETAIREGIILQWLKSPKGGILYLDGFNYAEPNIVSLIESLADFRGSIWIPELKAEFKRTAKHYLVISYNPSDKSGYSGTFIENIATIRRFEGLVVKYLSKSKETKLLQRLTKKDYDWCRKFVELGDKTRILYKEGKLRTPLTTGNLLNYARLSKAGLSDDELIEVAESLFSETERGTFRSLWEETEKEKISETEA